MNIIKINRNIFDEFINDEFLYIFHYEIKTKEINYKNLDYLLYKIENFVIKSIKTDLKEFKDTLYQLKN